MLSSLILAWSASSVGVGFGAFAQQDDAFDHVLVINDCAVFLADGFAQLAETNLGCLYDDGEIADADGCSIHALNDRGGNIVGGLHQADGTHIERLLAALDESATGVGIVVSERLLDLSQRQSV